MQLDKQVFGYGQALQVEVKIHKPRKKLISQALIPTYQST
jgi:hypothetical protein